MREKAEAGSASRMGDVLFEFVPFRVNSALDNNELTIHFTLSLSLSPSETIYSLSIQLPNSCDPILLTENLYQKIVFITKFNIAKVIRIQTLKVSNRNFLR